MGRKRRGPGRNVNGILVLDKPPGMTSNEALQQVKRLYRARKAGHTGSLDKPARGVLPICLGEATKLSGYLLDASKQYLTRCRLGVVTTTGDASGEILEQLSVPEISSQKMEKVLAAFRGEIMQVPPMYSALKHKGERLYKLAYQGMEVEREARPVTIHELTLQEINGSEFVIAVHCSKGTYIRTLVEDIGRQLGCGAHVKELQRTAAGPFTAEQMHGLEELEQSVTDDFATLDGFLLPPDTAVEHLHRVQLLDSVAYYLQQGQAVMVPRSPTEGQVRIYNEQGLFIGMGEILDDGRVAPRRMVKIQA
ncbi:MAG: tRNA pseudouridine(55) synthase TruB [Thiotrichales bacterium]|nr:tRNA pseudouridine(55) synthase TruB [Thiotrichales bacterium]